MKVIMLAGVLFCGLIANAQPGAMREVYAQKVNIYDANKKVVAEMSIIQGLKRNLLFKSCSQRKDSAGRFITEFRFCTMKHLPSSDVYLILQFDRTIDTAWYTVEGEATMIHTTIGGNSGTSFSASSLSADGIITAIIKSKRNVIPVITGIAGQSTD